MTELEHDGREIQQTADQYNARLVRRVDQTGDLGYFWVHFDGQPVPFEPGQYMTIGVFADGKLVQRPYSVASAPAEAGDGGYEFYVRLGDRPIHLDDPPEPAGWCAAQDGRRARLLARRGARLPRAARGLGA